MLVLLIAFLSGGFSVAFLDYFIIRRQMMRIDAEKQSLQQEQKMVVQFMYDLVESMGQENFNREALFEKIVHTALMSTGALTACVFERGQDGNLHGVAVEGLFPPQRDLSLLKSSKEGLRAKFIHEILKSETILWGEGLIGDVAKTGKAILIENAEKDNRVIHHQDPSLRIRSIIVAPIRFGKEVLGVLAVANPSSVNGFKEGDLSLVKSLAKQAGMAIHNSDLIKWKVEKSKLDFDLNLARNIQGMLLPESLPNIEGLDIDIRYQSAHRVGGDLYHVFPISEKKFALTIADVSGKGIPASLLMAICQTHLHHYAYKYKSPVKILQKMNRDMKASIRRGMFITMIYAILDLESQTITFARAGHELPLIFRTQNGFEVERVSSSGMALGMVDANTFDDLLEEKTVPFQPGDILMLYTDGVTEAMNAQGESFSRNRLIDVVEKECHQSAQEINDAILKNILLFSDEASTLAPISGLSKSSHSETHSGLRDIATKVNTYLEFENDSWPDDLTLITIKRYT